MSNVEITYDGDDISDQVMFSDAVFEQQMNAVPGTCRLRVHDPEQSFSFVTGKELRLFVDSVPMWGGYLRRVTYGYPFPADDTSSPGDYANRIWTLEGSDYNILWDSLVIRRESDYTTLVPNGSGYDGDEDDGWLIWKMLRDFSDFPSGFGITADRADAEFIDDIRAGNPGSEFFYKQQSTPLRDQMDDLAKVAGATYYISADKRVHYHAYESVIKKWGFSDLPNYIPISASPDDFQDSTWGFHEVEAEEDGSMLVTDALVWGGSPLGSNGDVLFARYQDETEDLDSTSTTYVQNGDVVADSPLDIHGRWQVGEVHTEGGMYGNLAGVKARANVIVNGPSGTAVKDGKTKGLSKPIWTFRFNWRAWQVPELSGSRNHILAGDIVYIELSVFDVAQFAPCRSLRVTFENLDPSGDSLEEPGDAYAILSGEFSYNYTDSTTLWKTLMRANRQQGGPVAQEVTTVDNSSTTAAYGAFGLGTPEPAPDDVETDFSLWNGIGYIPNTLEVFVNGALRTPGTHYDEVDPVAGTFTMTSAPASSDELLVRFRALAYP